MVRNTVIAMAWAKAGGFRLYLGSRTKGLADECEKRGKGGNQRGTPAFSRAQLHWTAEQ